MEVIAIARNVRRAPRKARLVAEMVRGLRVEDALAQLRVSPKYAAADVAKAVKSAAANAEHNYQLARDQLWVKTVLVDEGLTKPMRRLRPVHRGMAHQYFRRRSHITAIVEDRPEAAPVRPARRRPQRATTPGADAPPPSPRRGGKQATKGES